MGLLYWTFEFIADRLPVARRKLLLELAQKHTGDIAYSRLAELGFRPRGIVDVGAYMGDWTRQVAAIFPDAPILMAEAQVEKKPRLDAVRAEVPAARYAICLLGREEGVDVVFNIMESGSSIYAERSNAPRTLQTIKTTTLDRLIQSHPELQEPLFLKLDVQGAELDVLAGGPSALAAAEVVQLEVALLQYNEGAPLAHEVIAFMANRGFALFDVGGFVRPKLLHLVQVDLLFVKRDSRLRAGFFEF